MWQGAKSDRSLETFYCRNSLGLPCIHLLDRGLNRSSPLRRFQVKQHPQSPIVLVVDDDPAIRSSTTRLLCSAGHEVETFSSTQSLFEYGRPSQPCCLILDVRMPETNGLEFKKQLDRQGIRVPIIFITGFGSIPMGIQAMKEGAVDFLTKPFDADDLLRAVDRALGVDARYLDIERRLEKVCTRFASLTARERDVCFAVTDGLLNKQVGAQFGVSEKTIKVHRARVMEKMEAQSLPDLVRMADAVRIVPDAFSAHVPA